MAIAEHVEPWMASAACTGLDPDLFFTERGESQGGAKAVCADCTVRADCLDYALRHRIKVGVWGGCSERERRRMRQRSADPHEVQAPRSLDHGVAPRRLVGDEVGQ